MLCITYLHVLFYYFFRDFRFFENLGYLPILITHDFQFFNLFILLNETIQDKRNSWDTFYMHTNNPKELQLKIK